MADTRALPRVNPELLLRPRLLARLDRWSPVALLLAPSGAGTSVLAAQWAGRARAQGEHVLWFDGEVDTAADVATALARYAGLDPAALPRVTLQRLRRGRPRLEHRLAVVVDHAEPLVRELGQALVDLVVDCEPVHLVLCLQRRLDPVATALVKTGATVLDGRDLELTVQEVQTLAAQHRLVLSWEEASAIHQQVGGVASLVRSGLEVLRTPDGGERTVWSPRQLSWFLGAHMVPRLARHSWDAVRRAALVEDPAYGAVLAATGPLDEDGLADLERLGALDPLVTDGEPVVRMPPAMRQHFRERYDAAALGPAAAVHLAVVDHWLERGEPHRALHQAVAGRCWERAVDLAETRLWDMVVRDPGGVARDLRQLPAVEVRGHPVAETAFLFASASSAAGSPATRAWAQRLATAPVPELVAPSGDPQGVLEGLTLLLTRAREQGDLPSARALAVRTEAVLAGQARGMGGTSSPVVRRAALQVGATWIVAGDTRAAVAALRLATDDPDTDDGTDPFGAAAAGRIALCAALHGGRQTAVAWHRRWAAMRPHGVSLAGFVDVSAQIAAAAESVQALRAEAARQALTALRDDAAGTDLWPFAAWVQAQHALAWGGRARLRAEIAAGRAGHTTRPRSPFLASVAAAAESQLCLSLGRASAAERILDEVADESVMVSLARARVLRMTGRPEEARQVLEPALAGDSPFVAARVEALLLAAWSHLPGADPTSHPGRAPAAGRAAEALLRAAAREARRLGLVLPFSTVPRHVLQHLPALEPLVRQLDAAGVRAAYDMVAEVPALSPRERAVLLGLARGLSVSQMAEEFFVSRNTVKSQVSSAYRKLGVADRQQAVRRAYELGVLD